MRLLAWVLVWMAWPSPGWALRPAGLEEAAPALRRAFDAALGVRQSSGIEELAALVKQLDAPDSAEDRVEAARRLLALKRQGVTLPLLQPQRHSHVHLHTLESYPKVPDVPSATRVVLANHFGGANLPIILVDHEAWRQIPEALETTRVIQAAGETPPPLGFGIEFMASVRPDSVWARAPRSVGRQDALWIVAMGVNLKDDTRRLAWQEWVERFQEAKRNRAEQQLELVRDRLGVNLPLTPGNVTERDLSYQIAGQMPGVTPGTLAATASAIRKECLADVPLRYEDGFPDFEELVPALRQLGAIPVMTMQFPVKTLAELTPDFVKLGVEGFDLAGFEPGDPEVDEKIRAVFALADQHHLLVVGGADDRGPGTGWQNHAWWMEDSRIQRATDEIIRRSQRGGLEEGVQGERYQASVRQAV